MAYELVLVALALISSVAAVLASVIQREDRRFPASPERRAVFGTLLLDAALQWISIARLDAGSAGAVWTASFLLLIAANIVVGGVLLVRGHAVPNLVRWGGVLFLLVLEPAMLGVAIFAFGASA